MARMRPEIFIPLIVDAGNPISRIIRKKARGSAVSTPGRMCMARIDEAGLGEALSLSDVESLFPNRVSDWRQVFHQSIIQGLFFL